jgi:hypothetical protein
VAKQATGSRVEKEEFASLAAVATADRQVAERNAGCGRLRGVPLSCGGRPAVAEPLGSFLSPPLLPGAGRMGRRRGDLPR